MPVTAKRYTLHIPVPLHAAVKQIAAREGLTINDAILEMIEASASVQTIVQSQKGAPQGLRAGVSRG